MICVPVNTHERGNANATAKSRGRSFVQNRSFHFGMLPANIKAPISEVIESQRQGNCTSDSFGITAHTGWLKLVAIRNVSSNNTNAAFRARLVLSRLNEPIMK